MKSNIAVGIIKPGGISVVSYLDLNLNNKGTHNCIPNVGLGLEPGDVVSGWKDANTYWVAAIYNGGDPADRTNYTPLNEIIMDYVCPILSTPPSGGGGIPPTQATFTIVSRTNENFGETILADLVGTPGENVLITCNPSGLIAILTGTDETSTTFQFNQVNESARMITVPSSGTLRMTFVLQTSEILPQDALTPQYSYANFTIKSYANNVVLSPDGNLSMSDSRAIAFYTSTFTGNSSCSGLIVPLTDFNHVVWFVAKLPVEVGDIIYEYPDLTSPVVGNNLWLSTSPTRSYRINTLGVVTEIDNSCEVINLVNYLVDNRNLFSITVLFIDENGISQSITQQGDSLDTYLAVQGSLSTQNDGVTVTVV